jgi:16S rRNA (uracil1498-N3)-methyltransferase
MLIAPKSLDMPRFFVTKDQINDGAVTIFGDDAYHISRSLRMAAGEQITVCDMQKKEYTCVLEEFSLDKVVARVISERESDTEPPFSATVFQALPKGDKLDSVIQKSVECGASHIVTFNSERCIAKESGAEEKKLVRRNRIALEAAKQSGRGIIPSVSPTVSFKEAIASASRADIALFCYEGDGTLSLKSFLCEKRAELSRGGISDPTVSIVIGSEGGFSLYEVEQARVAGLVPIGLGRRILRTETASSFVLGCLVYEFEL